MNKTILIIVVAASVLVLGTVGAGFFVLWNKISSSQVQSNGNNGETVEQQTEKSLIGSMYPLDSFIINTADPGGMRYLRVTMDLELSDSALSDEITKRLPQIKDSILMILPTKKADDIRTIEGKVALRNEIIAKINGLLSTGSLTNLYFTEFVIQ